MNAIIKRKVRVASHPIKVLRTEVSTTFSTFSGTELLLGAECRVDAIDGDLAIVTGDIQEVYTWTDDLSIAHCPGEDIQRILCVPGLTQAHVTEIQGLCPWLLMATYLRAGDGTFTLHLKGSATTIKECSVMVNIVLNS